MAAFSRSAVLTHPFQVVFLQIAVPSREEVVEYAEQVSVQRFFASASEFSPPPSVEPSRAWSERSTASLRTLTGPPFIICTAAMIRYSLAPRFYQLLTALQGTLAEWYRAAVVCAVTPLRDGMNLVAKEYLAAQMPSDPGVLLLSRFAGARVFSSLLARLTCHRRLRR
jgi:hypothetical protein